MRASGMPALRALCLAFLPTVLPFGGLSYLRKPTADQAGLGGSARRVLGDELTGIACTWSMVTADPGLRTDGS